MWCSAGGLLVLTTVYELVRRKEAFGGGDIKLMAVLGLFLGLERGVVCLLAACVLSVAYVFGREIGRRVMGRGRRDRSTGASGSADHTGTGVPSVSEPFLSGAIPGGYHRARQRFPPRRHHALRPFHRPRHPRRLRRVSQENRENRPLDSGADKKSSCVWAAYPLKYMLASKRKPFPRIRSGSSVGRAAD
ncbi:MAG: prepilin peptidase [Adlercreutzia equolifaciens]